MHLVRLGGQYFNLDNASRIEDLLEYAPSPSNRINIYYAGVSDEDGWSVVEGAEADALRRYLQRTAVDLMGPEQSDRDYLTYRERGGELAYATWDQKHGLLRSYHGKPETWFERPSNAALVAALESELKL